MRIYRTRPTRSFSTFGNELLRDRSISWCAAGVLMYLLSLPPGARASIRSLAEQRKEGRGRIADSLRELENSRYLRRVVVKNRASGHLSTVYEVFDAPYTDEVPGHGGEDGRNLASGEEIPGVSDPLPTGVNSEVQQPPSPPSRERESGHKRERRARLPKLSVPEQLRSATELLLSLGRREPRLALGTVEAVRLAPLVEEWRSGGASDAQLRAALTAGLPEAVRSAPGILADRLRRKMPTPLPPVGPPPSRSRSPRECEECGVPLAPSGDCHACAPPPPPPTTAGFVNAARRGREKVRAALAAPVAPTPALA
ncbi:hypothetical protein ACFRMN_22125 [Streptomyces sp. NPDC056835]|uniref:hypothetical protein n=1 Tax=Streptomyces sp. NPDC056835 TaxID=3345956 RepID=UPI003678941B